MESTGALSAESIVRQGLEVIQARINTISEELRKVGQEEQAPMDAAYQ